ncbi:PilZ domain-containing protein [bacterium CPR1]|nr:PilZ domain-containing protein [bacterium CPR1]
MFGLFGPPLVEFVDSEGKTISFLMKRAQQPGRVISIRLDVPLPDKPGQMQKVNMNAKIITSRPNPGGGFLCVGETGLTEEALGEIKKRLKSAPRSNHSGTAGRRSRRYVTSIRVLSPELPGYRALTVDFSMHGMQLEAEGSLQVGKQVNITLELDSSTMPELNLDAKVVWCREKDRRKVLIGLEYLNVDEDRRKGLIRYDAFLAAREGGDIQQKQLADADMFLKGREATN